MNKTPHIEQKMKECISKKIMTQTKYNKVENIQNGTNSKNTTIKTYEIEQHLEILGFNDYQNRNKD